MLVILEVFCNSTSGINSASHILSVCCSAVQVPTVPLSQLSLLSQHREISKHQINNMISSLRATYIDSAPKGFETRNLNERFLQRKKVNPHDVMGHCVSSVVLMAGFHGDGVTTCLWMVASRLISAKYFMSSFFRM